MPLVALTRLPSPHMSECELSFIPRTLIDPELVKQQHARYEETLQRLGCELIRADAAPDLPDSVFVEDTAVVLDEVAIITRPGVASRAAEVVTIAEKLREYRETVEIEGPATVDGGDVLVSGRIIYVGDSGRTNRKGFDSISAVGVRFGYEIRQVRVRGCLHLKSAVSVVGERTLLVSPRFCDQKSLAGQLVEVSSSEPHAANALLVNGRVVYPDNFPETANKLEALGIELEPVDVSEIQKAEGGVTCCSIVFES